MNNRLRQSKVYLILSLSWGVYFPLLRILFGAVGVPVTVLSPNQLFSASAVAYAFWHMLLDDRMLWFSPAESWNVWLKPRSTLAVYLSSTTCRNRVPWIYVLCDVGRLRFTTNSTTLMLMKSDKWRAPYRWSRKHGGCERNVWLHGINLFYSKTLDLPRLAVLLSLFEVW